MALLRGGRGRRLLRDVLPQRRPTPSTGGRWTQAGKPVDPTEWGVPPQEVNAFYDPFNNEIVFPAAILQPPFFDYQADPAVNFGGIGFVIGHEITHGFDLPGLAVRRRRQPARTGGPRPTTPRFQALNDEVVAQYGAIEVLPGVFIDGQITVTENVADMGGVQVAYDALQTYLAEQRRSRGRSTGSPRSSASSSRRRPSGARRSATKP